LEDTRVVTCLLTHSGKVLVLKRSQLVGSYRGLWGGVAGYIEGPSPLEQAFIEIEEEVGLSPQDVHFVLSGEPLILEDPQISTRWVIHPFLFEVISPEKIRLDVEHTELRWINPEQLGQFDSVPGLKEVWERLQGR